MVYMRSHEGPTAFACLFDSQLGVFSELMQTDLPNFDSGFAIALGPKGVIYAAYNPQR